jgi:hypothetical protein
MSEVLKGVVGYRFGVLAETPRKASKRLRELFPERTHPEIEKEIAAYGRLLRLRESIRSDQNGR